MLDYSLIGQTLAQLRKESNQTQAELAESLNVSHQAVSKWERGQSLPDIETIYALGKLYNRTMDEILSYGSQHPEQWNADDIRNKSLQLIREKIVKSNFETWFRETTATLENKKWAVYSPSPFVSEWLELRYSNMIKETIAEVPCRDDFLETSCLLQNHADRVGVGNIRNILSNCKRLQILFPITLNIHSFEERAR